MQYCAIDLGATSGRVLIGWREEQNWKTVVIHRFDGYLVDSSDGLVWNIHQIENEIVNGLRKIKSLGYTIESIGIDSWAVDYILLDQKDKPLFPAYAYRNQRSYLGVNRVSMRIAPKDLYERTGIQFQPFSTIYQLASEENERMSVAATFLMIPDYFNFYLTGEKMNEYTNMSTSALLNASTGLLDKTLLDIINVKSNLFPPMIQPGSIIGSLRNEVVELIGFNSKVVSVSSHDTASAFIGHSEKDVFILSSGTWSLIGLILDKPIINHASFVLNLTNEGGVENSVRFLKNIMGLWIYSEIKRQLGISATHFELIIQAQNYPSDFIIDVNDDSLLAPVDMFEAVNRLIEQKYSRRLENIYELLYVVFNSLADNYTKTMQEIEDIVGRSYSKIIIVGGGSQNNLLNRLIEKKSGKKVILGPIEATAIGNMIIQDRVFNSGN